MIHISYEKNLKFIISTSSIIFDIYCSAIFRVIMLSNGHHTESLETIPLEILAKIADNLSTWIPDIKALPCTSKAMNAAFTAYTSKTVEVTEYRGNTIVKVPTMENGVCCGEVRSICIKTNGVFRIEERISPNFWNRTHGVVVEKTIFPEGFVEITQRYIRGTPTGEPMVTVRFFGGSCAHETMWAPYEVEDPMVYFYRFIPKRT